MTGIPMVRRTIAAAAFLAVAATREPVHAQTSTGAAPPPARRLGLGFAVDTTAVPGAWWGVDPALSALPAVVRTWRDYLAVRADPAKRAAFWSAADRARAKDPDPLLASESYMLDGTPLLIEALPLVAGDSTRWMLRTVYVGGGTASRPGLLGIERTHVVLERGADGRSRWALASPTPEETKGWHRARVGLIEYVVHPALRFDAARAAATARWADSLVRRFGVRDPAPVTYYQVPDLQAGFRVLGFDFALSADRVGGRASPLARVILAADPRYGEANRHELVHVLLHPVVRGRSAFVGEGIAYWLGGARGRPFAAMLRDLDAYLASRPDVTLGAILAGNGAGAAGSARLPAAAAIFELAHRRGGDAAVLRFVDAIGTAEPTLATVARALGITPARLEAEWRALVRGH